MESIEEESEDDDIDTRVLGPPPEEDKEVMRGAEHQAADARRAGANNN